MVQGITGCWSQVHKHDCAIEESDTSKVRPTSRECFELPLCGSHSDDCDEDEDIGDDDEDGAELNEATQTEQQYLTDVGI